MREPSRREVLGLGAALLGASLLAGRSASAASALVRAAHVDRGGRPTPPSLLDQATAIVNRTIRQGAPGGALAVYENEIGSAAGYGRLSRDGAAVDANSIFEISSITKVFTATLLAESMNNGSVSLDTPIDAVLPPGAVLQPDVQNKVTLGMLATYTSGLPDLPPGVKNDATGRRGYTQAEFVQFLDVWLPSAPPGSRYLYSDLGVGFLGNILGQLAGTTWAQSVAVNVIQPLGLANTVVDVSPAQQSQVAQGYTKRGQAYPPWPHALWDPAGILKSSAADLLKLITACINPVSAAAPLKSALPITTHQYFQGSGQTVGLTWSIQSGADGPVYLKDGSNPGFSACIGVDTVTGRGVALLFNRGGINAYRACAQLLGVKGKPRPTG